MFSTVHMWTYLCLSMREVCFSVLIYIKL